MKSKRAIPAQVQPVVSLNFISFQNTWETAPECEFFEYDVWAGPLCMHPNKQESEVKIKKHARRTPFCEKECCPILLES